MLEVVGTSLIALYMGHVTGLAMLDSLGESLEHLRALCFHVKYHATGLLMPTFSNYLTPVNSMAPAGVRTFVTIEATKNTPMWHRAPSAAEGVLKVRSSRGPYQARKCFQREVHHGLSLSVPVKGLALYTRPHGAPSMVALDTLKPIWATCSARVRAACGPLALCWNERR